jgi:hypothetical protein
VTLLWSKKNADTIRKQTGRYGFPRVIDRNGMNARLNFANYTTITIALRV